MGFEWGTEIVRRERGIPFLMYIPRRTHTADLLDDAARWATRTHLVQGERRLTYAEVFDRIERTAAVLHARGVRPGDRLLLLAPNSPEWVVTFWAGIRLGAILAPGNGWWSAPEVTHAVDLLSPALTIADGTRIDRMPPGAPVLDVAELLSPSAALAPPPRPRADEDDPALIIFTAGTTGAPKGVVLAHRSVIANLHNLLAVAGRLPHQIEQGRTPGVTLQYGPLFHIGGVQSLLLAMLSGTTVVFPRGRFDAGELLELIETERVTVWGGVPTMAARVLEHPDLGRRDLSSVRSITMGGAPVPAELLARLRAHFPNAKRGLSTIYGMTELGGTVAQAPGSMMAEHPDTAGRALPVAEIKIAGPDAAGDGEILVRTPGQLLGYWDATGAGPRGADVLDDAGYVHTGDLGRIVDGLLFVTGRVKDLIIRGGENVAPAHVEAALLTHPQVSNAAVLGRPDPDLGEIVVAVVQTADPTLTTEQLTEHLRPLLAHFAIPAAWWLRADPLPVTDAGKIDKRVLKATWPTA